MFGDGPVRLADGPVAEVARPANHDLVELSHLLVHVPPAPPPVGQLADSATNRLNLLLRRTLGDVPPSAASRVTRPERVAQKVERFVRGPTNVRLLLVDRQFQLPHDRTHRVHRRIGVSTTADHESSSPGELHPQALTEPDGNLSAHPALIVQSRGVSRETTARTSSAHGGPRGLTNERLVADGTEIV